MNLQTMSLKPDNVFHRYEKKSISHQIINISDGRKSFCSDVDKNNFLESLNACFQVGKRNGTTEDKFAICGSLLKPHRIEFTASGSGTLFGSNIQKNCSCESDAVFFLLKEDTTKPDDKSLESCFSVTSYDWDSSKNLSDMYISYNSELQNNNNSFLTTEVEKGLKESKYPETKNANPFVKCAAPQHIYTEDDFLKSSNEYGFEESHIESVKSMKCKTYSKENIQTDNSVKFEKLLICEDSLEQNNYSEECFHDNNCSITLESHLKECNESDFREEHNEAIDEIENNLLKSSFSNLKMDYPTDKPSENNFLEDESWLESMLPVIDSMCKNEEITSSCNEKDEHLIFTENLEPYCVEFVHILQSALADAEKSLHIKEEEVIQHKLFFETNKKKLESYNDFDMQFGNSDKSLIDLVDKCDKFLVDIKKDRTECEWHLKNIQNMLNLFQQNYLHNKL